MANTVKPSDIRIQVGTTRNAYITWAWNGGVRNGKDRTDGYSVQWEYYSDGIWWKNNPETTSYKQSQYAAPDNATRIRVKIKPLSKDKTNTKGKVTGKWFTSEYCELIYYTFVESTHPVQPSGITTSITGVTLTVETTVADPYSNEIQFVLYDRNTKAPIAAKSAVVGLGMASVQFLMSPGVSYMVWCRGVFAYYVNNTREYGPWYMDYTEIKSYPDRPAAITRCDAITETSVQLDWSASQGAESYEIQYTTEEKNFDNAEVSSETSDFNHREIGNLSSGYEYYFRVRAKNGQGDSEWSPIAHVTVGKTPEPPTTYSNRTIVMIGQELTLYWIHNSADNSTEQTANIRLFVNDVEQPLIVVNNNREGDDKKKTSSYLLDISNYSDSTVLRWSVQTKGIMPTYSEFSIERTITVYAPVTLSLKLSNEVLWYWSTFEFAKDTIYTAKGEAGESIEKLTKYPLVIGAIPSPESQTPIGYYLTITANNSYDSFDEIGRQTSIGAGEAIYQRYFDIHDKQLSVCLMPNDIIFENNQSYTVSCVVSMKSGLSSEPATAQFTVALESDECNMDADFIVEEEDMSINILPYVYDENGEHVGGYYLSLYRRQFDGSFILVGENVDSSKSVTFHDPHPALDYARYRIVAKSYQDGTISFYDLPAYQMGEKAVIIQWNEQWSTFDVDGGDDFSDLKWNHSLLRLPYNIDFSDNYSPDVELVSYIGRENPVSYYGTQHGQTASCSVDIVKSDEETLYGLRRLAIWMGDVYIREPSGTGYWANVTVSFSQTHCELVIPVSIEVTRVEGGL